MFKFLIVYKKKRCSGREKSSKSLKKNIFRKKKSFQLICTDKTYKTVCRYFFKNKWVSGYLTFPDFFGSEKLLFTIKLLIKLDRQKIKKISHLFWRQLSHKSSGKVSASVHWSSIFLTRIVRKGFPTSFTSRMVHLNRRC